MPVQPREEREANEVGDFPWPVWMTEPFRQTAHRPPDVDVGHDDSGSTTEFYTRAFGRTSASQGISNTLALRDVTETSLAPAG